MRGRPGAAQSWGRGGVLVTALLLLVAAPARSQLRGDNKVSFADLLSGHARAAIGMAHLPNLRGSSHGVAFTKPGVVVTATLDGVFVEGARLVELDRGRVASDAVRLCKSGVACLSEVRRHIARIRADLAAVSETRPPVIIVADARLPYPTLLLLLGTTAEAGAALSILIAARSSDGTLTGVPVWVTPSSEIILGRSQEPALATVSIRGPTTAVSATATYMEQSSRASNIANMKEILGRIELRSGRTTCLVNATSDTTLGQVIPVVAAIREVFPHVLLTDQRGLRISGR